jgi:hypothetical protein
MAKVKQPARNGVTPTSGREWRKAREEGYVITLPSGNAIRLRSIALDTLILSGKLPDLLTPVAARSLWTFDDGGAIADETEMAKNYAELIHLIVRAGVIEPRIVENPEADDEISMDDLEFNDKVFIFNACIAPAAALQNFRDKQATGLDAVHNGKGDSDTAV